MRLKITIGLLVAFLLIGPLLVFVVWPRWSGTAGAEQIETITHRQAFRPDPEPWDRFLQAVVDEEGMVDYNLAAGEAQKDLDAYIAQIAMAVPAKFDNDQQRLAFYINAYNALVIKGVLRYQPIESVKDVGSASLFFRERAYHVAGVQVSLHGFEQKVIRRYDPRLHFALNCASYSCPPLSNRAYRAETLDQQLEQATRRFLGDPQRNQFVGETWRLSQIFQWYAQDFKPNVVDFIQSRRPQASPEPEDIEYLPYDWSLNRSR